MVQTSFLLPPHQLPNPGEPWSSCFTMIMVSTSVSFVRLVYSLHHCAMNWKVSLTNVLPVVTEGGARSLFLSLGAIVWKRKKENIIYWREIQESIFSFLCLVLILDDVGKLSIHVSDRCKEKAKLGGSSWTLDREGNFSSLGAQCRGWVTQSTLLSLVGLTVFQINLHQPKGIICVVGHCCHMS